MAEREKRYITPSTNEPVDPRRLFTVNTGDQETIEKHINEFFGSVIEKLGYDEKFKKAFVEKDSFILHRFDESVARPTDDRITYLVARGVVVASVLERRDDFNYIQVASASYLNPEMIRGIGELPKTKGSD